MNVCRSTMNDNEHHTKYNLKPTAYALKAVSLVCHEQLVHYGEQRTDPFATAYTLRSGRTLPIRHQDEHPIVVAGVVPLTSHPLLPSRRHTKVLPESDWLLSTRKNQRHSLHRHHVQ